MQWFDQLVEALRLDAQAQRRDMRINGISYISGVRPEDIVDPATGQLRPLPDDHPPVYVGRDRSEETIRESIDQYAEWVVGYVRSAFETEMLDDIWSGPEPVVVDGVTYAGGVDAVFGEFFRGIGWQAVYHRGGPGNQACFVVDGEAPLIVEVGVPDAWARIEQISRLDLYRTVGDRPRLHDVLVLGSEPVDPGRSVAWPEDAIPAGVLGQRFEPDHRDDVSNDLAPADTGWVGCTNCGNVAVHHCEQSFHARPCGCYDSGDNIGEPDRELLRDAWNAALDRITADTEV
ncbi:hypothetical protein [Nocardia terpenica]|uniref:Uncharacterized protein n=1 Tax=Nocardia terpenica TaxID=455432 RepID=A0A164PH48_9NOCA|nr:hypothetical protein [Nocardia terpenica]KZM75563.1 hypothetical protein AWN90_19500 [Nocardia terpenica]NQE86044.1 hypothetical protein [Nocardia terpenica]